MASLQKIRSHGALLIVIVGLAMLAFILGDFLNNSSSLFHRNDDKVGTIAGNKVSFAQYDNLRGSLDALPEGYLNALDSLSFYSLNLNKENMNVAVWNAFKLYYTYNEQAEKMGMAMSDEEMSILYQNLPYVPEMVVKGIFLQQKYVALLRNTFKINSLEAEFSFNSRQQGVSAEYVMLPYDAIADSLVEVSESDIKAVYDKHKAQLKQEPTRTIEYVTINYAPSEADFVKEAEYMASIQEDFSTAEDIDDLLKEYFSDEEFQDVKEYTEATIPAEFKEFAFGKEAKVGACSEIQFDSKAYAMARIIDLNKAKKTATLAILKHTVNPSDATKTEMAQQLNQFLNENNDIELFEQAAKENGFNLQMASVQELTQKVNGIQDSRKIINWAFKSDEGDVCKEVFECGEQIVIAAVVEAMNDKYVPMERVRSYLTIEAMNNAKAAYIVDNYTGTTLAEAAQAWNQPIQSVARVTLADNTFGNFAEPAVVGTALALGEHAVSAPIQGNMGVYVVQTGSALNTNEEFTEEAKNAEFMQLSRTLNTKFQQAMQLIADETEATIYNPDRL